jgi:CelD/BcsL family acetyltransferase involved in cellulose biosynthesis
MLEGGRSHGGAHPSVTARRPLAGGGGPRLVVSTCLDRWAVAWDELVDRLPLASPFLRSWWLEATAGARPRFVLVCDGDELIGGLALEERRIAGVPLLRVMGAGALCPDHLDLVAAPGREDAVVACLASWLGRPGSRLVELDGIVSRSRVEAALPGRVRHETVDGAPWIRLPAAPSDYEGQRPRSLRRTVGKTVRRLTPGGMAFRSSTPATVDRSLLVLRQLHLERWGGRSHFLGDFERFAAASRLGAARGELVVRELVVGGTVVAAVACFEVAGRLSLYQSGHAVDHRWRNALTVLLDSVVEDACRRGCAEVDLLRGTEPYKLLFASECRTIVRLSAATGARGRLALGALILLGRLRRAVSRLRSRLRSWERPGRLRSRSE